MLDCSAARRAEGRGPFPRDSPAARRDVWVMSAVPAHHLTAARLTIGDLWRPEFEGRRVELWEGEPRDLAVGSYSHNLIISRLILLFMQLEQTRSGVRQLPPGTGCIVAEDTFLIPDAGLHTMPIPPPPGLLPRAPEIAVEIASPANTAEEFARKRQLYFSAGAEQVWELMPEARVIVVHFPDGTGPEIREGTLVGTGIADGVTVVLADLFAMQ